MKSDAVFTVKNGQIIDSLGRVRIFRGMNVGGNAKLPINAAAPAAEVSFVGRPFGEDEADDHFQRLASMGCTLLRWVITWEAVEHSAPGVYDEEYLAYLRRLFKQAEHYGLHIIVDPHQDAWSRWTGGDGAPEWTLRAVGLDPAKLERCGAAFTQDAQGAAYEDMPWPLNYQRYACATMFTLFWGGDVFAPGFNIDGVPVQQYLQQHYIDAMYHTARRIKDCHAVVGFGIMNEPHSGYIGLADLAVRDPRLLARKGMSMTPFDGMTAASGYGGELRSFAAGPAGLLPAGKERIAPCSGGVFLRERSCPWKTAGVWKIDTASGVPVLCRSDYFAAAGGRRVDFARDFLKPFQERFIAALAKKHRDYLFFIDGSIYGEYPQWRCCAEDRGRRSTAVAEREGGVIGGGDVFGDRVVLAFHWYDGLTLTTKKWNPLFTVDAGLHADLYEDAAHKQAHKPVYRPVAGKAHVQQCFTEQLARTCAAGREGNIALLAAELGVPFDLKNDASHDKAREALSMYYNSLDELLLSCTLWHYNADNTESGGDNWNGENMSVFSREDGIRALRGFCRPFAMAVAGTPRRMRFCGESGVFEFEWDAAALSGQTLTEQGTVFFIPDCQYPHGWVVERFDGSGTVVERPEEQRLFVTTVTARTCLIRVAPRRR